MQCRSSSIFLRPSNRFILNKLSMCLTLVQSCYLILAISAHRLCYLVLLIVNHVSIWLVNRITLFQPILLKLVSVLTNLIPLANHTAIKRMTPYQFYTTFQKSICKVFKVYKKQFAHLLVPILLTQLPALLIYPITFMCLTLKCRTGFRVVKMLKICNSIWWEAMWTGHIVQLISHSSLVIPKSALLALPIGLYTVLVLRNA